VEAHGGELLVHARKLAGEDAEDVLQEALLRALRSYDRLSHGNHLRAWLYRITTTTAFDNHKERARRAIPTADPPEPAAGDHQHLDDFAALIEDFPEQVRATLQLRFVEDLDYEAIAHRMDCSPAAARQRVSSAVRSMRRRMS
ncbi:MAG: sigma-70 family RNA polymerase sigma factor, partial [Actinomycetota bacterium]|nr:sigma-70 family RNA polymerase sigma factor [Actinomycetota bacterium]